LTFLPERPLPTVTTTAAGYYYYKVGYSGNKDSLPALSSTASSTIE